MRVTLPGSKGAELTRENADVRIVDVSIQDIRGPIPVFPLPDNIGDQPQRVNVRRAVEARCFVLIDPFSRRDLVVDRPQFLRNEPEAREIFHKLNLTQEDSRIKLAANFLSS
jgi:hypothetical protein